MLFFDTCSCFLQNIFFSRPERQEEGKDGEQDTSGVVPKARFRGTVCSLGSHGLLGKSNLQVHNVDYTDTSRFLFLLNTFEHVPTQCLVGGAGWTGMRGGCGI